MIYVMSDLHGMYEKYMEMLEKIQFNNDDILYILGDVCDRGEKPAEILLDMMSRHNVFPVMGNHDYVALDLLKYLNVEITEDNYDKHIDKQVLRALLLWQSEGGEKTIESFRRVGRENMQAILEYMEEFPMYEVVDTGGKTYILAHAGLGHYRRDKKLSEYTTEELLETREILDGLPFGDPDVYLITGHTPTFVYTGEAEIIYSDHQIMIDCGAVFDQGRLACLCLNTGEDYYV